MALQTFQGPVPTSQMGITLSHEHVFVGSGDMVAAFGDRWVNRRELVDIASKQLTVVREKYGVKTVIDGTATDTARDVALIREVSERSGVQMAYTTGLYHAESPFIAGKKPEEFAKYFISECLEGSAGTNCRPAFLKCATGALGMTEINRIEVATMAVTQRETGLPLFCHNTHSIHTADMQMEIFREYGADLSKVIVGHASDSTDVDYLMSLHDTGAWLSFDRIGPRADGGMSQAKTLIALMRRGADRLLLSHDHCVYLDFGDMDWPTTRARGYENLKLDFTYIFREFLPLLRSLGVTDEEIDTLLVKNPARAYGNPSADEA